MNKVIFTAIAFSIILLLPGCATFNRLNSQYIQPQQSANELPIVKVLRGFRLRSGGYVLKGTVVRILQPMETSKYHMMRKKIPFVVLETPPHNGMLPNYLRASYVVGAGEKGETSADNLYEPDQPDYELKANGAYLKISRLSDGSGRFNFTAYASSFNNQTATWTSRTSQGELLILSDRGEILKKEMNLITATAWFSNREGTISENTKPIILTPREFELAAFVFIHARTKSDRVTNRHRQIDETTGFEAGDSQYFIRNSLPSFNAGNIAPGQSFMYAGWSGLRLK